MSETNQEVASVRDFCDQRAEHGRQGAVRDPSDTKGLKNRFINLALQQALHEEVKFRGDEVVLDFGCGTGLLTERLADEVAMATGIDISFAMLQHTVAKERAGFCQYNGSAFPLRDKQFDYVFSCEVMHLLSDAVLNPILAECHRVLKVGGKMVSIEFVSDNPQRQDGSIGRFERARSRMVALFEAHGFQCKTYYPVRRGRSIRQYLIRYGLCREAKLSASAQAERAYLRDKPDLATQYNADFLYVFERQDAP